MRSDGFVIRVADIHPWSLFLLLACVSEVSISKEHSSINCIFSFFCWMHVEVSGIGTPISTFFNLKKVEKLAFKCI